MTSYDKSGQASSFADSKSHDEEKLQLDQYAVSVQDSFSWTPEEEKKARRKVDFIVMPILILCFFSLQLDRADIGNSLTDGFLADVGITQDWFNVGQQLLYLGIVLLEIPSNVILYRVGPKVWIGGQILAWGLVATFQMFQKGLSSFLITRLLLGLFEAGFIPASLYVLSSWYTTAEISKRFAIFFLGNGLASAVNGLLAYGILHMRGIAGLTGWQWMFLLEGLFTILAGILFICAFPGTPSNPVTLTGIKYFNEREITILQTRVLIDDPAKVQKKPYIDIRDIVKTLSSGKLWLHVLLTIAGLAPSNALWIYAPSMVASFGFDRLGSNAMTSVGQWISVILVIIAGFWADKWGRRGYVVAIAVSIQFIFTVAYKGLPDTASAGVKYGILTMASATCSWWHAVHGSWIAVNSRSPAERSIRMAMFITAANVAGIVGGQLFRADDKPFYHRGWTIAVAFLSLAVATVGVLLVLYKVANRKISAEKEEAERISPRKDSSEGVAGLSAEEAKARFKLFNY